MKKKQKRSNNDILKFKKLVNEVLKDRKDSKADKDIEFLKKLFNNNKYKNKYKKRIECLKRMYSVARTLNQHLEDEDWKNLFTGNKKKYKSYEKNAIKAKLKKLCKFLDELLKFLMRRKTKINGGKKLGSKGNCVVSALSKYGYYETKEKFPIYDTYAEKYIKLLFQKLYSKDEIKCLSEQTKEFSKHPKEQNKYWWHFFRYAMILHRLNSEKIKKFEIKKHLYTLISGVDSFVWMYGIMKNAMTDPITINKKEILCYSQTCGDVSKFIPWYENAKAFLGDKDKK